MPKDKDEPILAMQSLIPQSLSPLVLTQSHRPQLQLGYQLGWMGTMYKHTWWHLECLPVSGVPEPGCSSQL